MQYNKTLIADGMARLKVRCPIGQVLRGHNYIQHWWQDRDNSGANKPGAGGTIDYKKTMANP